MLTIHDTPKSIITFHGGTTEDSKYIREQIREKKCWGFIENRHIHIYFTPEASRADLMDLMAHEISHRENKKLILAEDEEALCCVIAEICTEAYGKLQRIGRV